MSIWHEFNVSDPAYLGKIKKGIIYIKGGTSLKSLLTHLYKIPAYSLHGLVQTIKLVPWILKQNVCPIISTKKEIGIL